MHVGLSTGRVGSDLGSISPIQYNLNLIFLNPQPTV